MVKSRIHIVRVYITLRIKTEVVLILKKLSKPNLAYNRKRVDEIIKKSEFCRLKWRKPSGVSLCSRELNEGSHSNEQLNIIYSSGVNCI